MNNFDLKKYLAEGKLHEEFEGETNDKINDIAIAVVDELESKLDSESSGILKGMDYYVGSDGRDNDEVEQGFTKWFIDLVKYLSKNNNEVTISSVEQDGKVFTPAITLKYLDNGKEDISWKITENKITNNKMDNFDLRKYLAEGRLLKEEEGIDILSFLKSNKQELLDKLAEKYNYDEDDIEMMGEYEIGPGADADGNEDAEIAGLGEAGLDFSFNPKKVKDTYGDASNFKLVIAGKPIYGIAYNM